MKPWLSKRYEVAADRADLYAYFFERGLRLLKHGGRLGYISSSTFFKTGSGKPLRDYLRQNAAIETIVDFGDHQIFEGVTTYPVIITMRAETPDDVHALQFWTIEDLPKTGFREAFAAQKQPYTQKALTSGSWELESPALQALRHKIISGKKTLKEVYGSPCRGIVTGLNEAFVIDAETKERLCKEDPKSLVLLKPFLEGKDLKRWRTESRGLWIIYIPKKRIEIDDYVAIRNWLFPFKARLEKRATKQEWYALQQAQEAFAGHFEGQKIIYPDLSQGSKFHIDKNSMFSPNTSYVVPSNDASLLALLNSNLNWFFLRGVSGAMRGGEWRLRLFSQYIESIPIPDATPEQKTALGALAEAAQAAAEKCYALQQSITRRIPDLAADPSTAKLSNKLKSWWELPDFAAFTKEVKKTLKADIPLKERNEWQDWINETRGDINALSAEIVRLENEINAQVYSLFDLTPDEITLLEANI